MFHSNYIESLFLNTCLSNQSIIITSKYASYWIGSYTIHHWTENNINLNHDQFNVNDNITNKKYTRLGKKMCNIRSFKKVHWCFNWINEMWKNIHLLGTIHACKNTHKHLSPSFETENYFHLPKDALIVTNLVWIDPNVHQEMKLTLYQFTYIHLNYWLNLLLESFRS